MPLCRAVNLHLLHPIEARPVHIGSVWMETKLGAIKPIKEDVARRLVVRCDVGHAAFKENLACHAKLRCGGGGLTGMIRLYGAMCDHGISTLRQRVSQEKLQFSCLVAPHR